MTAPINRPDDLTIVLDRVLDAPRSAIWRCWTEPDLLMQWHCPRPWRVGAVDMDLRAGGRMNMVMEGPDGERIDCVGSYLEVVTGERLTFTDAYSEGFVPTARPFMTGFVILEDAPAGRTRMVWGARHLDPEAVERHLAMGFETGWNAAADQLEVLAAGLPRPKGADLWFRSRARTCLFLASEALEAAEFYCALLPDSAIDAVHRPDPDGPPLVVEFTLSGMPVMALNGNPDPRPSHTLSLSVLTDDQDETDRLWTALCADGGEPGACGWLRDRFGVHWQIVPKALPRLMHAGDAKAAARVSGTLMTMGKIEIAELEAAFGSPAG